MVKMLADTKDIAAYHCFVICLQACPPYWNAFQKAATPFMWIPPLSSKSFGGLYLLGLLFWGCV